MCVRACVCVCVRARMRACMRVYIGCMRAGMWVCRHACVVFDNDGEPIIVGV